jgi:hypothetical protein
MRYIHVYQKYIIDQNTKVWAIVAAAYVHASLYTVLQVSQKGTMYKASTYTVCLLHAWQCITIACKCT